MNTATSPAQTVTLSAEVFEGSRSNTTVFVAVEGSTHAGQFMFKGKDHKARAATFIAAVSGTFDAMTAILTIDAASTAGLPTIAPGFGFAASIIETARAS